MITKILIVAIGFSLIFKSVYSQSFFHEDFEEDNGIAYNSYAVNNAPGYILSVGNGQVPNINFTSNSISFTGTQIPFGGIANNTTYFMLFSNGSAINNTILDFDLSAPMDCEAIYTVDYYCSRFDGLNTNGEADAEIYFFDSNNNIFYPSDPNWKYNCTNTGGSNNDNWDHVSFTVQPTTCSLVTMEIRIDAPFNITGGRAILIDNISVSRTTTNCSSTAGCLNFSYTHSHGNIAPLKISNLSNYSAVQIVIFEENGDQIQTIGPIYDPPNTICWNGKKDDNTEAAPANYQFLVYGYNDCNPMTVSDYLTFTKQNDAGDPTIYDPTTMCYHSVSKPPIPCCINVLSVVNETLYDDPSVPGPTLFSSSGNIDIHGTVSIPASICDNVNEISFQADNLGSINLSGLIDIEQGAVTFELAPCPNRIGYGDVSYFTPIDMNSETDMAANINLFSPTNNSGNDSLFEMNFSVTPNPTSKFITISISSVGNFNCQLTDVFGKAVLNIFFNGPKSQIDVSKLPTGLYWLQVSDSKGQVIGHSKLVVQ